MTANFKPFNVCVQITIRVPHLFLVHDVPCRFQFVLAAVLDDLDDIVEGCVPVGRRHWEFAGDVIARELLEDGVTGRRVRRRRVILNSVASNPYFMGNLQAFSSFKLPTLCLSIRLFRAK